MQQPQPLYYSLTGGLGGFGRAGVPLHAAGGSYVQGTIGNRPTAVQGGLGGFGRAGVPLHAAGGSYVQGTIGNRPAAVQGQIEKLRINPSFKVYAENNPVQSKIFEEVLSIRDCSTIAHFKYPELL